MRSLFRRTRAWVSYSEFCAVCASVPEPDAARRRPPSRGPARLGAPRLALVDEMIARLRRHARVDELGATVEGARR